MERTWWALSAVVVATCMLLPDSTAVNVALPPSRLPRSGPMWLRKLLFTVVVPGTGGIYLPG